MPSIDKIEWGKNLRPSTVDIIKKLNESIDVLNSTDISEIESIKEQLQNIASQLETISDQISSLNNKYNDLEPRVNANEDSIDKIKITLYTPLSADEDTDD